MVLALAEKLHKFPREIEEEFTEADLAEWGELWRWQAEEREKLATKAKQQRR